MRKLPARYIKTTSRGYRNGNGPILFLGQRLNLWTLASDTGLDPSHLSRIFAGKRQPNLVGASILSERLGMTIDSFVKALDESLKNRTNNS